jgi:hypothetical protein
MRREFAFEAGSPNIFNDSACIEKILVLLFGFHTEAKLKITNIHGLPETLVNAVKRDNYSKGKSDYSVTEIMSSPRITRLRQAHYKEMEQDVVDKLWAVMGTAIHKIMEDAEATDHIKEERLYADVDGVVLSGGIDLQKHDDLHVDITDYKFTSAWALRQEKTEWVEQLNIYAWLVFKNTGKYPHRLRICAIIRDWSRRQAMTDSDYPQGQAQMVDIEVWDLERTEDFIKERIALHKEAKVKADWGDELPECTESEKWIRETKYAVMKDGRKTAVRVYDSPKEADDHMLAAEPKDAGKLSVVVRKGEAVRCTGNYCGVAKFCSQFKRDQEKEHGGS